MLLRVDSAIVTAKGVDGYIDVLNLVAEKLHEAVVAPEQRGAARQAAVADIRLNLTLREIADAGESRIIGMREMLASPTGPQALAKRRRSLLYRDAEYSIFS